MPESSIARHNRLMRYLRKLFRFVGVDVSVENYKINYRTLTTGFLPLSIGLSYIYMIFSTTVTLSFVLEGVIMMSLVVQGTSKLVLACTQAKKYYKLFVKVFSLYTSEIGLVKNAKMLSSCIKNCLGFYKLFCLGYGSVFVGYICFPIFEYCFYEKRTTIFPVSLPFTDLATIFGFTLNILHQTIFIFVGVVGVLAYDVGFLFHVVHSIAIVNVFKIQLVDFSESIIAKRNNTNQLIWCVRNHQIVIDYFEDINDTYTIMALIQIISSGGILSISVFLWLWDAWIVAPILIIVGICQLFEFCILGTITQIQNEVITNEIYDMLWYLLPARDQQLVLFMLLRAQKPTELNAGKFAKLNVETGLQVMKTIYSFAMMFKEVIG